MQYVSLHHHSTFSFGDGFGLPKEHVEFTANAGGKAQAFTEHGNLSSFVQAEKACKEHGIKPIFGLEGYIANPKERRKCHQTILASTQEGLSNLNRLVSQSWRDFYRWPTIHLNYLEEFNEGLIVLSGCADSLLSCTLLGGKHLGEKRLTYSEVDYAAAIRVIEWYKAIFEDRYFLEVQRFPGLDRCRAINPAFERLSADTGVPLVATSDCHYVFARDAEMQKILHAAHRNSTISQQEAAWEYSITLDIPSSDEQVLRDLRGTGLSEKAAQQALLNTAKIADRCNVVLPKVDPLRYNITEGDYKAWV
jgi:DNA polymerase-3 subunit alpha